MNKWSKFVEKSKFSKLWFCSLFISALPLILISPEQNLGYVQYSFILNFALFLFFINTSFLASGISSFKKHDFLTTLWCFVLFSLLSYVVFLALKGYIFYASA